MQYKVYNLKGLNIRSSDLVRDIMEASDLLNVYRNKRGEIEDRPGTSHVDDSFGGDGLFRYDEGNELIGINGVLGKLVAGAWETIENTSSLFLATNKLYSAENIEKSLYFTNT